MKILWIGPNYRHRYNFHHELFADEAARCRDVIRYGHGLRDDPACLHWGAGTHVPDIIGEYGRPDLVVLQHPRHCRKYTGLDKVELPKVCLVADYFPRNHDLKNRFLTENRFDLAFFPETSMVETAREFRRAGGLPGGLRLRWLPFSADISVFRPLGLKRRYDVTALFSGDGGVHYPNRNSAAFHLDRAEGLKSFVKLITGRDRKVVHEDYVRLLNRSEIAVASNDRWGSVNLKHFEIPACGAVLMTDRPRDFEALGFEAGRHYLEYRDPARLPGMVASALREPDALHGIRAAALRLIEERHTVGHRAEEMFRAIDRNL